MRRAVLTLVVTSLAPVLAIGCGEDRPATSEAAYCEAARANAEILTHPSTATTDDIAAAIDAFATMHRHAPLGVEPEWAALEALVRAAAQVAPGDDDARARFATLARETKVAADRVVIYTQDLCGVLIGDSPVISTPLVTPGTMAAADDAASDATTDGSGAILDADTITGRGAASQP